MNESTVGYTLISICTLIAAFVAVWIPLDYRRWRQEQHDKECRRLASLQVATEEIERVKWAGDERFADEEPPYIGFKQQVFLGSPQTTGAGSSEDGGKPRVLPG